MSEFKQQIYFFAETPRAGQWNHRFIVPENYDVPDDVLKKYGELVREGQDGYDFVGVRQEVKQILGNKAGYETLILVVPNCNLSKCKSQIKSYLHNLQPKLEELVTQKINWDREGKSLIISNSELTKWQHDLQPLLKNICHKTTPTIGEWIMQHKFLCAITIIVLITICVMVTAQTPITDGGNAKTNITENIGNALSSFKNALSSLKPTQTQPLSKAESLQKWLSKLDKDKNKYAKETDEKVLEKDLCNKLAVVIDAGNDDLPTILNKINCCFNPDLKTNLLIDKLLENEKLLENVAKLYENGQFNLLAFCTNPNDEVESTFYKLHNVGTQPVPNQLAITIENIRNTISSAIEVKKSAENVKNENNWFHFAQSLSFMENGNDICERWISVTKHKPQWITKEDINLSRKIYQWLVNDDANALLKGGDSPSNYNEALERFAGVKIDFDTTNRQTVEVGGVVQKIVEHENLLESLRQFQKYVKESPFSN